MKRKKLLFIMALAACLSLASYYAYAVMVREIPGGHPLPWVSISGCGVMPCEFHKGEIIYMYVELDSDKPITAMEVSVRMCWMGLEFEIPLPNPDGCDLLLDATCPIPPGEWATLCIDVPAPEFFPDGDFLFTVIVRDQDEDVIGAFEFDAVITG